ncbi:hypothetical protein A3Q33_07375 [Colwellia sp. PAMC 21821]|nr:hypothetical protein A3Q33_07375 [Colwellia sp. PAMC 21821]
MVINTALNNLKRENTESNYENFHNERKKTFVLLIDHLKLLSKLGKPKLIIQKIVIPLGANSQWQL